MRQYPLVAVNESPLSGYERTSCGFATGQEKYRTRMEWPALTEPRQEMGEKRTTLRLCQRVNCGPNRKRVTKNSYSLGPEGCKNRGRSHPQGSAAPISSRPQLSPRSGPALLQ